MCVFFIDCICDQDSARHAVSLPLFSSGARWNAERQAVEFWVEIGEYHGVLRVPRRVFQRLPPERPTPERCVEAYYLQRTRFEHIAERKVRRAPVDRGRECRDQRAGFALGARTGSFATSTTALTRRVRAGMFSSPHSDRPDLRGPFIDRDHG
jgi:hypothetical protein